MTEFKPLETFEFPRVGAPVTDETLYWKRLGFPYAFKEFGAIDYVDFCQQDPYHVAATCSAQVQIYSTTENALKFSLSRFKQTAYGGVFRKDGKLLAAGSDDGFVRLFEVQSHKLLRIFKGHTAATHRCNFTMDGIHLVSFSDDKTVALWDIPTEKKIKHFDEHNDYIRAGVASQASQEIFISGSYDHSVKMYDSRTKSSVMSVDHGAPVESVLIFPTGGLFVSAGGTSVKVWDPVAGRLLTEVSDHHKTITCLCLATDGRRLMSASLDRHIKIYDVTSYEVVHTLTYPSPILSVAVAPEDKMLAVGMTDGLLSIRHQKEEPVSHDIKKKSRNRHQSLHTIDFKAADEDVVVPERKKKILKKHENYLRKFESTRALDAVLKDHIQNNNPEITMTVIMDLMRRQNIRAAMAGREGESLLQLIKFINKYIGDPRFMKELIDVGLILSELYGPKLNDPGVEKQFQYLLQTIENQIQYMKKMMEIQGIIQTVLMCTSPSADDEIVVSGIDIS